MNGLRVNATNAAGGVEELGSPVGDELLDVIVRKLGRAAGRDPSVLSVAKGRQPGELLFWTSRGPTRVRVVERQSKLLFINLHNGRVTQQADKAQFVAEAGRVGR